jgi:hypothetical protein
MTQHAKPERTDEQSAARQLRPPCDCAVIHEDAASGALLQYVDNQDGFIAWISSKSTGGAAFGAANTISAIRAMHSAFPVANNSRNERMRDMNQSIAATITFGLSAIRRLDLG